MKNPATHTPRQDEFNAFTQHLKDLIDTDKKALVRLRDGTIVDLGWFEGTGWDEGYNYFCFESASRYLIWNNDGTSFQSHDFDMMETVD